MPAPIPLHPFDPQRYVGSVCEIFPTCVKCNLPNESGWVFGHKLRDGQVGEFVVVESTEYAIFGRVTHVQLPEKDRLAVEPKLGKAPQSHPVGIVQFLVSISLREQNVLPGIVEYPRLGSRVFSVHPLLFLWITNEFCTAEGKDAIKLNIAHLPLPSKPLIGISPEALFGRHCVVIGTTGGGKSWTLARLTEEVSKHKCKLILLDATGEYRSLKCISQHVHLGKASAGEASTEVVFPYEEFTEQDFFAILKPSLLTQLPKLREAIKSLKLARILGEDHELVENGQLVKAEREKQPFIDACEEHSLVLQAAHIRMDVTKLSLQIAQECAWPSSHGDSSVWGQVNQKELDPCSFLQSRIEETIGADALSCIFKLEGKTSLVDAIKSFLDDDSARVLRVSLKYLPAANNCREVVANSIGRFLLDQARLGAFANRPVLVFLDEAHQFVNRSLGDENNKFLLDAFDLIAKEGRKFSLNICLATQRPRDIPEGVLSQMGAFIVHRLIHDSDRTVVERASGDIDKAIAAFLPTFVPGEALLMGVGLPLPLAVHIVPPTDKPISAGSKFQEHWREAAFAVEAATAGQS
jgi:DNA helicase HerA-like ATPase